MVQPIVFAIFRGRSPISSYHFIFDPYFLNKKAKNKTLEK